MVVVHLRVDRAVVATADPDGNGEILDRDTMRADRHAFALIVEAESIRTLTVCQAGRTPCRRALAGLRQENDQAIL